MAMFNCYFDITRGYLNPPLTGSPWQNEAELLILNSDGLEAKAEDAVTASAGVAAGASTASVPLVALEAAAPQGSLGQILDQKPVVLRGILPSGYVKIAIENGHL